ncbi:MAG: hypothetical protein PW791_13860 [Neorhizobium sp.]|nr:hypothetical protein [Neorhizobium sp.]
MTRTSAAAGEDAMQDIYEDFDPMVFRLWDVPQRSVAAPELKSATAADAISAAPLPVDERRKDAALVALAPALTPALSPALAPALDPALAPEPAPTTDDAATQFRLLLNDMTVEMRAQFSTFRSLRQAAERLLADGDETAQKLARADVKAATDAMSLIVRTLEKIDTLQRQLLLDRERAEDEAAGAHGFEEAKARVLSMIEDRANAKADMLYRAWQRDGPPAGETDAAVSRRPAESAEPAQGPPRG